MEHSQVCNTRHAAEVRHMLNGLGFGPLWNTVKSATRDTLHESGIC